MSYFATGQLVATWLRGRFLATERLIEVVGVLVLATAFAGIAIPIWLLLAYRPDRDHPVNKLLEACQEGARRGSLAVIGFTAGIVVLLWALLVVGHILFRATRDLAAMRRFGRTFANGRESSFLAGGVQTDVRLLADRVAFTSGLFRPRVYVGAGLVAALQPREIEAVLLHEHHHRVHYDPLRSWLVELALALPFFRAGRSLTAHYRACLEAAADRAAVDRQGDDRPLLIALTKADALQSLAGACGLSTERQQALRQIRHLNATVPPSDRLAVALGLSAVVGLLFLAVAGLSDWQWYWFCPTGSSMRQ